MKYVRTKDSIYEIVNDYGGSCAVKSKGKRGRTAIDGFIVKYGLSYAPRADTIEELCDEFVMFCPNAVRRKIRVYDTMTSISLYFKRDKRWNGNMVDKVYGAIWTDKGLIYVAKMNDKGELELL